MFQRIRLRLRAGLAGLPWPAPATPSAIQPLMLGDSASALALMDALEMQGIWVPAIRPPTVAEGTARLRISLSALHSLADVDRLVAALTATTNAAGTNTAPPRI